MVHSSSGHAVRAFWPITTGDPRCIYQLGKGSINQGGAGVCVCVFYDELGYFKYGIAAAFSSSSSSSLLIFLLSALKQLHSPLPWVSSCKLNEAESLR